MTFRSATITCSPGGCPPSATGALDARAAQVRMHRARVLRGDRALRTARTQDIITALEGPPAVRALLMLVANHTVTVPRGIASWCPVSPGSPVHTPPGLADLPPPLPGALRAPRAPATGYWIAPTRSPASVCRTASGHPPALHEHLRPNPMPRV